MTHFINRNVNTLRLRLDIHLPQVSINTPVPNMRAYSWTLDCHHHYCTVTFSYLTDALITVNSLTAAVVHLGLGQIYESLVAYYKFQVSEFFLLIVSVQ
jgi:hypothetical protein